MKPKALGPWRLVPVYVHGKKKYRWCRQMQTGWWWGPIV